MKMYSTTRRKFVKLVGSAAVLSPVLLTSTPTLAEDLVALTEDDPVASSLGYKEDGSQVDAEKYPSFKVGQVCSSCTLYQGGESERGGCGVFPGKEVSANAWCAAYAAKA